MIWASFQKSTLSVRTSNTRNSWTTSTKFQGKITSLNWHSRAKTCQLWLLNRSRRNFMSWNTIWRNFYHQFKVCVQWRNKSSLICLAKDWSLCLWSAKILTWFSCIKKWAEPITLKFQLMRSWGTSTTSVPSQFSSWWAIPLASYLGKTYKCTSKRILTSKEQRLFSWAISKTCWLVSSVWLNSTHNSSLLASLKAKVATLMFRALSLSVAKQSKETKLQSCPSLRKSQWQPMQDNCSSTRSSANTD